ncbi:MAG TPA: sugar phosphate nucleotidyltransferase [Draconibacterium sp.]|nr:sugar phosphate nucleotidyltransferase [Draconibacterium sp.]
MEAMIFAAGLGTRLKEETANKPKALVEVGGKTLLRRAIEKITKAGASQIVVNVHHFPEKVIQFIQENQWEIPVKISDESGLLLETGGGLKKAASLFSGKESILLYNVDVLSNVNLQKMCQVHQKSGTLASLLIRKRESSRYFMFDQEMQLVGWINKKSGEKKISRPESFEAAQEFAFSGIHFVQPEIFEYMPNEERFSIIKLYLELAKSKTIKGLADDSDLWMDVGKPDELALARELFRDYN